MTFVSSKNLLELTSLLSPFKQWEYFWGMFQKHVPWEVFHGSMGMFHGYSTLRTFIGEYHMGMFPGILFLYFFKKRIDLPKRSNEITLEMLYPFLN